MSAEVYSVPVYCAVVYAASQWVPTLRYPPAADTKGASAAVQA